jgi:hypothetical protein
MPIDPTQKKSGLVNSTNGKPPSSRSKPGTSFGDILAQKQSASKVKGANATDDDDSSDEIKQIVSVGSQSATAGMSGPATVDDSDEPSLDEVEVENP